MLKVELVSVDFEFINDISCFGIEEFEKSGLYKVFLGSRNSVEEIEFISDSNICEYKDKEELIKENIEIDGDDDYRDHYEDYCSSWVDDNKVVYEVVNEEECFVYFYLKL